MERTGEDLQMHEVTVAAVDVGSPVNIGWWAETTRSSMSGRDLDSLADVLAAVLNAGGSAALGFEAPLFVPVPTAAIGLNRQRMGERGRPWCAGAGTGALAMGTQQAAYVFARLPKTLSEPVNVGFDPAILAGPRSLVVWEAFVSAGAKNRAAVDPHVDDARVAATEFVDRLRAGRIQSDVDDGGQPVLNLVAAGLLRAELTMDVGLLRQACIVVRAPDLQPER